MSAAFHTSPKRSQIEQHLGMGRQASLILSAVAASRVTRSRPAGRQVPQIPRAVTVAAVLFATARFALSIYSGRRDLVRGDFAATLPGGYVQRLNPTLWNSPDLIHSWAYHEQTYFHGPTQFLTLYQLAYFNSYAEIARFLLIAYVFVILAAFVVMWRMLRDAGGSTTSGAAVYAATLSLFPVIQAYSQREFENVILLAIAVMFWAAVRNRQSLMGTLLAYITWFKYLPILIVPYVALRRWTRALVAFIVASIAILGAAHWLFDLRHFVDNPVPSVA